MQEPLKLPERLDGVWVAHHFEEIPRDVPELTLDMSATTVIDSAGLALVRNLQKGGDLRIEGARGSVADALERLEQHSRENEDPSPEEKLSLHGHLTESLTLLHRQAVVAFSILTEMLFWGTVGLFFRRNFRKGVLADQMFHLGYGAVGIVASLTFLIGVALGAQSLVQLGNFGLAAYTMSMVVLGMVREMGPLLVAIIFAGRTGSSITAEIATMSVQEEVDALKTMGLNHIQFIVVPKFWAATLTIPFLTVLGITFGILGGVAVARIMGGQSWGFIFTEFQKSLVLGDFIISILKSFVFAWLVVWVGSYYGFQVKGGAEEVGRKTTSSVVASIFVIVVADALFSFVYDMVPF
ncbi:MAG: ABC transporter permease [Fibrobacterota bacterium]